MPKVLNISDTESLSDQENEKESLQNSLQNIQGLGFEMRPGIACSTHIGDNVASSSGTNLRSSFIGMGFQPSLIDKVIKEKGEGDPDVLLDTLFAYTAHQELNSESSDSLDPLPNGRLNGGNFLGCLPDSHLKQAAQIKKSASSDSLDNLLDDESDAEAITGSVNIHPKQEVDVVDIDDDKRASLLMMNFSMKEVDFAISKLGKNAQLDELVDFITATQIAESEKNGDELPNGDHFEKNEDGNTEALFGTMDKTLQLLGMGFSEHEVSLAIEKIGSELPITELANWICATQMGESYPIKAKHASMPSFVKTEAPDGSWYHIKGRPSLGGDAFRVKTEPGVDYPLQSNIYGGIQPKEEYCEDSNAFRRDFNIDDLKGKRPKEEVEDDFSTYNGPLWKRPRILTGSNDPLPRRKAPFDNFQSSNLPNPNPGRSLDKMVSGPPYFLYGNVLNLSTDEWKKVSQFVYMLQPEFVNTQFFSALNRKEGYIHNLPMEGRFHIEPKSSMTIEEAITQTKKWWPSWDSRKQLSYISSETAGTSYICSSLGKMMKESRGVLSIEQQAKILHHCRNMNLVWVGPQKLAPVEPEHLERILGYPLHHTQNPDLSLVDRLESLRNCFQTDTLGYHLSVLKSLFPGGITLLSLYSGIGGAEVTLRRLGIYLKGVVSVESSETKRKILRRWWQNTDQTGELVQIDDIQRLTSSRLENLKQKLGGFDLIICQNPCNNPPKGPNNKVIPGSGDTSGLDFTMFFEFVRVLQRVRNMAGRS